MKDDTRAKIHTLTKANSVIRSALQDSVNETKGVRMDGNEINERLRALASDDKRRSETARLRDLFDNVEAALEAGVSQADVLAELNQAGFSMTINSFKSALQRIRKQRSKSKNQHSKAVAKATGAGPTSEMNTSREALAERLEPPKTRKFEHKPNSDKNELF